MPWGKYEGRRLDSIPMDYWEWCLGQEWYKEKYDLHEYARDAVARSVPWEEVVRAIRRL
jgi:hypothetical protein